MSNKLNALIKDFLTPPSTAGDPPVADVTNGETIQATPRLTYNLGSHTGLTFIRSTTDNYDLSGVDQSPGPFDTRICCLKLDEPERGVG